MILSSYIVICYACVPFCFALIQRLLFAVHLCLCSCAFVLRLLPFCCIYSTFSRTFIAFHQHLSPSPPSFSLFFLKCNSLQFALLPLLIIYYCICGFGWQGSGIKNEMRKNEDSDLRYKHTIVINFHCLVCNYGHTCLCKLSMC